MADLQEKLSELQQKYEKLEDTNQDLTNRFSELYILYKLTRILSTTFDPEKILRSIFQLFQESLPVDYSSLFLVESFRAILNLEKNYGFSKQKGNFVIFPNQKILDQIIEEKKTKTATIRNQEEIDVMDGKEVQLPLQFVGCPVSLSNNKVAGSLHFFHEDSTHFSQSRIDFYERITQEVSNILDKIFLFYLTKENTFRDHLTGVYNRRYFNQRLKMEVKRAERYDRSFSILMIDIDGFKDINDQYGHVEGDKILQNLVRILGRNLRKSDVLIRYGGEEFIALLPETNAQNAFTAAEKLRKKVENQLSVSEQSSDEEKYITVSIGVASFPTDAETADRLIDQSDKYLYKAKENGKNCTVSCISPK